MFCFRYTIRITFSVFYFLLKTQHIDSKNEKLLILIFFFVSRNSLTDLIMLEHIILLTYFLRLRFSDVIKYISHLESLISSVSTTCSSRHRPLICIINVLVIVFDRISVVVSDSVMDDIRFEPSQAWP